MTGPVQSFLNRAKWTDQIRQREEQVFCCSHLGGERAIEDHQEGTARIAQADRFHYTEVIRKSVRMVKLNADSYLQMVEAGGVEFKSQSLTAHLFSALRSADHLAIADLLTFGTALKSAILIQDFRASVLRFWAGNFPSPLQPPAWGHRRKQRSLPTRQARKCPPFFSKPRSRSVSRNERICAENGGRKGPSCA